MKAEMKRRRRWRLFGRLGVLVAAIAVMLAVLAGAGLAAQTCSIYWTGATSSDWLTASNWSDSNGGASAGRLPSASDLVCMSTTPALATITLASGSVEVGGIEWGPKSLVRPQLTIGGTLQVDSLADQTGSSAINSVTVTGTLIAQGSMSVTTLTLEGELEGPDAVTVPVGGTLSLGGSAPAVLAAGADLVNNGTASQASPDGRVELNGASALDNEGSLGLSESGDITDEDAGNPSRVVNGSTGTLSSGGSSISADVTNDGTITLGSGSFSVGGSGSSTSSGTFAVSAGATLTLSGEWTLASGASTSSSAGMMVIDGSTTAMGSNELDSVDVTGVLIAKGTVSVSALTLNGEVDGPGTVSVASGGSLQCLVDGSLKAGAHVVSGGPATVADLGLYGASELENSGTLTVLGAGGAEFGGIFDDDSAHPSQVVNDVSGTITVEQRTPEIQATVHNHGLIMIPHGAQSLVIDGEGENTDTGTLQVDEEAHLFLEGSWTLGKGTTVSSTLGGNLSFDTLTAPGNNTLDDVDVGTLVPHGPVSMSGDVSNLQGPGAVTVPSDQALSVSGTLASADLINRGTATVSASLSGGSTIENAGTMTDKSITDKDISDPSRIINDNSGTLTSGGGSVSAAALTNNGTLSVTSASASFGGSGLSSSDGGTLAVSAGASLILAGTWSLAKGASTSSSSVGEVQIPGTTTATGANTLDAVDVTGTLIAKGAVSAPTLTLAGELEGPGSVTVPAGGSLTFGGAGPASLKGAADLINDGTATQDASIGTVDMYGASRLENAGSLALADGQGIFDQNLGSPSQVINDASGTLSYAGSDSSANVSVTPALTNDGEVNVTGGTLSVPALTNLSGGVLTGGSYHVLGGTLALPGDVESNAAKVGLGATGAISGASANALGSLGSNTGILTLEQSLATTAALSNSGTINVARGVLSAPSYTQTAGSTGVAGGATLQAGSGTGAVVIEAGELKGNGTVAGDVSGAGMIVPAGAVAGPLKVSGTYSGSSGTLSIPISGVSTAGTDYGQLSVTGAAKLGGTLTISTAKGYEPPVGTAYTILEAARVPGRFSTVNGATLSDRHYVVSYTPTSVVLTVVGAPSVTSVSPQGGSTAGGNKVTIDGAAFTAGTTVAFGATAATSVTLISGSRVTATAPAHSAATVNVTVHTPGGTSARSSADDYAYGAPTVSSVSPNGGPAAGGNTVTITGTGYVPGTTVKFGPTASSSVSFVTTNKLTAKAPAHSPGTVNITVHTAGGTSATSSADLYQFAAPPTPAPAPTPTSGSGTASVSPRNPQRPPRRSS